MEPQVEMTDFLRNISDKNNLKDFRIKIVNEKELKDQNLIKFSILIFALIFAVLCLIFGIYVLNNGNFIIFPTSK